jgi:hypothetical protein
MNTTDILIAACVVTLLSLILKFIRWSRENTSIFLDIKKKRDKIIQEISKQRSAGSINTALLQRFKLAASDWFSAAAIMIISYLLLNQYLNKEPITTENVFRNALLVTLLLFNIIFLAVSIIERRIGYWIDEFTTIVEHILEHIHLVKGAAKKPSRAPAKKKRRR